VSKNNGHQTQVIAPPAAKAVTVELTQEQVGLLIQMIKTTPVTGNLQTILPFTEKLLVLQGILTKSLSE